LYKFSTSENTQLSQGKLSKQQLTSISDLNTCKNHDHFTVIRYKFYAYWKVIFVLLRAIFENLISAFYSCRVWGPRWHSG